MNNIPGLPNLAFTLNNQIFKGMFQHFEEAYQLDIYLQSGVVVEKPFRLKGLIHFHGFINFKHVSNKIITAILAPRRIL
jgi:hypothetical protein